MSSGDHGLHVPFFKLGDCCKLEKGNTPIQKATPGIYPLVVTTIERKSSDSYQFDEPSVCIPLISSRGHGVACLNQLYYQEGRFALGNILCAATPKEPEKLSAKFLFYYLNHKKDVAIVPLMRGGANVSLTVDSLKGVNVPIPPIDVQNKIVEKLNVFEKLSENLTAELTARKKQYEYYRDELFDSINDAQEYEMGQVLTFLNGRAYQQSELLDQGKYPVLRVGNFYTNNSWYYSDLELEENKYCDNGDLLYSWAATLGPKIWDGGKCIFHYHIWKIVFDENLIDKQFLYYFLQYDLAEIARSTTKSTMVHVSMASMKERKIKIPSLSKQKRIAGLLKQFDDLCTSTTTGLPAEIEARDKQYNYYRDQLLTFQKGDQLC